MRLLCLHADTVEALERLGTSVDDLTPGGLWGTPYHLVTVSPEQRDALQRLRVTLDDVTPTALRDGAGTAPARGQGGSREALGRQAGSREAGGTVPEAVASPS
jgi:hypothetical protein